MPEGAHFALNFSFPGSITQDVSSELYFLFGTEPMELNELYLCWKRASLCYGKAQATLSCGMLVIVVPQYIAKLKSVFSASGPVEPSVVDF